MGRFARAALCAALLLLALAARALATEDRHALEISLSASPSEMVEPQDISLTFTIRNTSDAAAENVYISSFDGLLSEPIGQIAPGETQTVIRAHSVTGDELRDGYVSYIITHDGRDGDADKVNYTVRTDVLRTEPMPAVEFTRRMSSGIVAPGGTVTLAYDVKNTGNVALSSLRIRDPLGEFTGWLDSLAAGESRTFLSRVAPAEDSVSQPEISYAVHALDDEVYTCALEEAEIRVEEQALLASLAVVRSGDGAGTAKVVLTLSCQGSAEWYDVAVTDDILGGLIADGIRVVPGELSSVSRECVLMDSRSFRWRVSARCGTGETVDVATDTVSVPEEGAPEPAALSLWAEPEYSEIGRSARVSVRLYLENAGGVNAENVAITGADGGEICAFAVVPPGDPIVRDIDVDVSEDTELVYTAAYADGDGAEYSVSAQPVSIRVVPGAPVPSGAEDEADWFDGGFFRMEGRSVYVVMLIAAGAVLVLLAALLMANTRRERRARRERRNELRRRQKEEMGKTATFTPVRQRDKR